MSAIKVRLIHGYQTCNERQCATVAGLGLYRLGDERLLPDTPQTMGMIRKVPHLLAWEKVAENPPQGRRSPAKAKPEAEPS